MKTDVSPDTRELTTVNGRSDRTTQSYMMPDEHIRRRELDSTDILTPQQLAERLKVKPSWIYEQTRNRSGVRNSDPLPYIKMGLFLRFDWRDVLAWLERQKTGKHNPACSASGNSRR
jgi:hypothetical protein